MKIYWPNWKTEIKGRRVWLWLTYLVVAVAVLLLDSGGEPFATECHPSGWTAKLWHQHLSTAGYRKPRAHYVRIITLADGREPVGDKCVGRRFVASLLSQLRNLGAAEIVIDKFYSPNACSDQAATAKLQESINEVSASVPVVLAQDCNTYDELRAKGDPDAALWDESKLEKGPSLLAGSAIVVDGKASQFGVPRLACNNWQIPMKWRVYPELHGHLAVSKDWSQMNTLAFAAAQKFDSDLAGQLANDMKKGRGLGAAFLPLEAFHPLSATQVLCGSASTKYDSMSCTPDSAVNLSLRGKIALIGEYSDMDTHDSVIGPIPGFLLQANYIESFLDDRYYRLIPQWLDVFLVILCLLAVDIAIEKVHPPHFGALWALAGIASLWAVAHFSIMQWGYYFTFWAPAVLAVLVKWLEKWVKCP